MLSEITSDRIVAIVHAATHIVCETMLGLKVVPREVRVESNPPVPTEGVLALVGMAGEWVGNGTVSGSAETARFLAGKFLMQDYAAVDDEVLDAIGEISNMIFGNVKSTLEEELGPMGLSIPTVIYGHNFLTRSVGNHAWHVIPFKAEGHHMEVRICLGRKERASNAARMTASFSVLS